jgi:Na+-translocating ferredoxin:NAD+ oxidoreductase RnfG subunit
MIQLGIIIVLSLFTCCSGFLLDDRTQPQTTTIPTLSDKHFNMLFDILVDEKRSHLKLEERTIKLENELLATQKGVTNNYHTGTKNNETIGQ